VHAACLGNDARVGRVNAVDISEDQAFVGLQCSSDSHCGRIRTAPAQSSDIAFVIDALETCDDDDTPGVKFGLDAITIYGVDARLCEGRVGTHRDLPPGEAACGNTLCLQCDGQQRTAGLLTGGGKLVQLAAIWLVAQFLGKPEQTVSFPRPG